MSALRLLQTPTQEVAKEKPLKFLQSKPQERPTFFKTWGASLIDALKHPFTPVTEEQAERMRIATEPVTIERKESALEQWTREGFPLEISGEPPRQLKTKMPREVKDAIDKYNAWRKSPRSETFRKFEDAVEVIAPLVYLATVATSIGWETIRAFIFSPRGQELLARKVSPKQAFDIMRRATAYGRGALTKWENKTWQFLNDRGLLKEAARYGARVPFFRGEPRVAFQRIAPAEVKFYAGAPVPKEIITKYHLTPSMVQRIARGDFTNIPAVAVDALSKVGIVPKVEQPLIAEAKKYKTAEEFYKAHKVREGKVFIRPDFYSKGKEGFSENVESVSGERPLLKDETRRAVVYRDKKGVPQGVVSFHINKEGQLETREEYGGNVEVFVNPEYRRKRIATQLYEQAKKLGYDLDTVEGRVFTKEGAELTHKRLTDIWEQVQKAPILKRPPSVKKILGIEPSPIVKIEEQQLLKLRMKATARGAKLGIKAGRTEVKNEIYKKLRSTKAGLKEIKTDLIGYAKEHLSLQEQRKLIIRVRDISTKRGLAKAMQYVDKIEDKARRGVALEGLKKDIKKLDLSKLRPEYRREIESTIGSIDFVARRDKTITGLQKTLQYVKEHPDNNVPEYVMRKLEILNKKKINDLTTEDLGLIKNIVEHAKKLNDLKNKLIFKKKYQQASEVRNEALNNLSRRKTIKKDPNTISTLEKPVTEVGVVQQIFGAKSYNAELISEILDKEKSGIIQKTMYLGIDKGYSDMLRYRHEADDYFKENIKADINKWSEKFHTKPTPKDVDYQKLTLPSGKKITFTKAERIALYLHMQNDKNLRHILEGGFAFERTRSQIHKLTSEDLDYILDSTTPEELYVAKVVYNYLNTVQKNKLNEVSVELNGWEVATEKKYFLIRTNALDRFHDDLKMSKNFSHKTLEGMGILKPRTNAANAIILEDVFSALYKSIKQTSAYYGMAIPLRNAKMLLNDNVFQRRLIDTYGEHYLSALRNYLRDIEGNSYDTSFVDKLTLDLINKLDIAVLGLNPWVMAKQPISLAAASTEIDAKYLLNLTPESIETMSKWHPQLRDRFEGNVTRELGEIGQIGEVRKFWTHKSSLSQKLMSGIRNFDYQAVGRIWKAVEAETNDLHPALIGDAKMRHIADRTWEIVRKTQPTFAIKDRSEIGRSTSVWIRLLTKYTSQRNKNYMMMRRAIEEYNRGNKAFKDRTKLVKKLAVVAVLMPAMLWAVDEIRNRVYKRKPPKRMGRNILLSALDYNLGNVYFVGNAFRSFRSKVERGKWGGYDISDVFTSSIEKGIDSLVDLYSTIDQAMSEERYGAGDKRGQLKWKHSMYRFIDEMASFTARFKGLPYDTVKKLITVPFKHDLKLPSFSFPTLKIPTGKKPEVTPSKLRLLSVGDSSKTLRLLK